MFKLINPSILFAFAVVVVVCVEKDSLIGIIYRVITSKFENGANFVKINVLLMCVQI